MKTKHTKGKWEVGGQDPDIYIESGLKTLCKLWGQGEEQEANAKLITAAPDLLECLDYVLGSFSLERTENFDLLNKCKEAIKKATS